MNPFDKYNNQSDVVALDKWLANQQALNTKSKTPAKKKGGRGGTLTSLISEGGALGGAAAGAAAGSVVPVVGTAIGGILGGAAGAFAGRVAENKVRDNRIGLGDAAKEAGTTALLSGPLKLAKYAGTAGKLATKGGASLEEALTAAAAKSSAKGGIAKAVGSKLQQGSDELATRALKVNGSQFNTDFANKTGEEVGQFATRFGLVGKDAATIRKQIYNPAQKVYSEGVKSIGAVKKTDVLDTIKRELQPKIDSPYAEDKDFAKNVIKQASAVLKGYKGSSISAEELNKLKTSAYKKVNVKFVDKSGVDNNRIYETLSNSFRKSVGDAADKAGLEIDPAVLKGAGLNFKSTKLSELGNELNHLNELTKQIDVKSRVGKGSNLLGLGKITGAVAGGAVGGPIGAVGGAVATGVANNAKVLAGATNSLDKIGGRLVGGSSKIGVPGVLKNTAKGAVGSSLVDALMGADQSGSINPTTINADTNTNPAMNSNIGSDYQSVDQMSTPQVDPSPYSKDNLFADLQRDPKNASKYIDYYKSLQEIFAPADDASALSAGSRDKLAVSSNAVGTLDQLEGLYGATGGGSGKLGGTIKNALGNYGLDGNAATYNALSDSSVSQLAKAINGGGQVSDADAAVIVKALPRLTDSPEVARAKFNALKQRLNTAKQNTILYGSGGGSSAPSSLEEALMAQGA